MISHKDKCIFIHIPKTGGTSLFKLYSDEVGPYMSGESHLQKYQDYRGSDYYITTFVRNPWDRMISEYKWLKLWPHAYVGEPPGTFKDYCNILSDNALNYQESESAHLMTQLDLISFAVDSVDNLDFTGRFENFERDLSFILKTIGSDKTELPHENQTNHKHYIEHYDDETRQIVAEKYAKDIEYFGYEFRE